jgi:hypothetical protein
MTDVDAMIKFMDTLITNLTNSSKCFLSGMTKTREPPTEKLIDRLQQAKDKLNEYSSLIDMYLTTAESEQYKFINVIELEDDGFQIAQRYKNSIYYARAAHKNATPARPEGKAINEIDGAPLQGNTLRLPIAHKIAEIPPMFHWFEGSNEYKKGVYVCLCPGFYVRVAFPNVLVPSEKDNRLYSLRCKYESKQMCDINKKKISQIHNSEARECFYVHKKERFNKVSTQYRCIVESLGNHDRLDEDLGLLTHFDIKHLLMYSLSDDLLAALWYQNKFLYGNLLLSNLDTY